MFCRKRGDVQFQVPVVGVDKGFIITKKKKKMSGMVRNEMAPFQTSLLSKEKQTAPTGRVSFHILPSGYNGESNMNS